jgi:L-lysine 2,3-aminomutase
VGEPELRFAATDYHRIHNYVARHTSITDLLVTGGDAFAPTARRLSAELLPLIEKRFAHISTFRFGTKVLAFWPHRFMNDRDSDELLRLIERLVSAGKNVAVMAHFNHPRELEGEPVREAVRRLRSAGAVIRTQGPVLRGINDAATTWQEMWTTQTALGMAPYYMFVARDTGPRHYFEVPLARTWQIYRDAIAQVSGIARTARGPVMSAGPGKVELTGVADVGREKAFVLRFLQARDPAWCHRPFFAKFDSRATWLSNLRPALNDTAFFFEAPYLKMIKSSTTAGTILERPYPATRENPAP